MRKRATYTGTYTVNSNCTGVKSATPSIAAAPETYSQIQRINNKGQRREREVAALFDPLEKGRHETASFSDEEAAAKWIERFVMDDRNSSASVIGQSSRRS